MRTLKTGDRVKLTGQFLRSTGQMAGGEGCSRWTIVACSCGLCRAMPGHFVATDEDSYDQPGRPRHIATANLYRIRTLDSRNT